MSTFNVHNPIDLRFLTRILLKFSQLNEHKSRNNFRDSVSPMCCCGSEILSTEHILLHCLYFHAERNYFFKSLHNITHTLILNFEKDILANVLLFALDKYAKKL